VIEMIRRFLRQKSRSTGTLIVVGLFAVASAFTLASTGGQTGAGGGAGFLVLLVLAAACVAKDASGGALQMILARPIRRTDYLFGRYFGIVAAFAAFLVACSLLGVVAKAAWNAGGPPLSPQAMLAGLGYGTLWAAQTAAVFLFFSSFLPGYGDAVAFLGLQVLLSVQTSASWYQRLAEAIRREVMPAVPWDKAFGGDLAALAAAGRGVLATVVFLAAASLIFARREFVYGQD